MSFIFKKNVILIIVSIQCLWSQANGLSPYAAPNSFYKASQFHSLKNQDRLNVASWNVRQATVDKLQNKILVNGSSIEIFEFIGQWIEDRQIDVFSMQEVYEKHRLDSDIIENPVELLLSRMPSSFKVLQGSEIRSSIAKGKSSQWKEFCPIFYDSKKVTCQASEDQMLPIGLDYLMANQTEPESRFMHWAYCKSTEKKFDFVMTCLHANYKIAAEHVRGSANVINQVFKQKVLWPKAMREENFDFILAGDFNLDRRTSSVFENLGFDTQSLDYELPIFKKGTRWKREAFTKLKDIYTFSEARKRSTDIYDDVLNSQFMSESLVFKFVDSLIDDYFIKQKSNRVDMESLLSLSDHLPVISTFDMTTDKD